MTRKLARIVIVARRSISWSTLNFFKIYYKQKFKEFAIHNVKNQTNPKNCLLAEKYAIPSGNDRCPDGTTYVSIKGTQFFPRPPLQRVEGRLRKRSHFQCQMRKLFFKIRHDKKKTLAKLYYFNQPPNIKKPKMSFKRQTNYRQLRRGQQHKK